LRASAEIACRLRQSAEGIAEAARRRWLVSGYRIDTARAGFVHVVERLP
jgi:hypothetical protein